MPPGKAPDRDYILKEREVALAERVSAAEIDLKIRQAEIQQQELAHKKAEFEFSKEQAAFARWSSPIILAVLAAGVGLFSNSFVSWLEANQQADLEKQKSQWQLIVEMIKSGDVEKTKQNLDLIVKAKLISDEKINEGIRSYLREAPPGIGPGIDSGQSPSPALLGSANFISRMRRESAFHESLKNSPEKARIISYGDSWFQYPMILDDVIDYLVEDYSILSFDAAGASSVSIPVVEIVDNAAQVGANGVILSIGLEDIFGPAMRRHIRLGDQGIFLGSSFDLDADAVMANITKFADALGSGGNSPPVFVHGYDYFQPVLDFFGKEAATDPTLRGATRTQIKHVIRDAVDRFNNKLKILAERNSGIVYIDLRGSIPENQWYDPRHPMNEGFRKLADRIGSEVARNIVNR